MNDKGSVNSVSDIQDKSTKNNNNNPYEKLTIDFVRILTLHHQPTQHSHLLIQMNLFLSLELPKND